MAVLPHHVRTVSDAKLEGWWLRQSLQRAKVV